MLALRMAAVALMGIASASAQEPKAIVELAVKAVGGEDKLLKIFRYKEQLNVSSDPAKKGFGRSSVLQAPEHWWVGKTDRVTQEKEPAVFLVWAWTLGALTDSKSKLEAIPEITEADKPAVGVRVSGTIAPPMDVYFDKSTNLLVRIDWRTDIHRFADWKEHDGVKYASKCVGYKKASGKPWYFTEILELERLKEVPAGLLK